MANEKATTRNSEYVYGGGADYVIKGKDDYILVDTTNGPITIWVPNIMGSGLNNSNKQFFVTDRSGTAAINNITLISNGNLINGESSIVLSTANITAELVIVNNAEWQANLSSDNGGPSSVAFGNITGIPSNQINLQDGTIQGVFTPTNAAIITGDSFKNAFQKTQGQIDAGQIQIGNKWDIAGNTLSGTTGLLGSLDSTDWSLMRAGIQYMSLISIGVRFQNAFGQADTGAFSYKQNTGRIVLAADNGSTSGGAIFAVYGTTGGTTIGSAYLDGSFVVTQFVSAPVNTFMINNSGNVLLGTTTGVSPTAKLDIRLFSSSDSNKAISITNAASLEIFKITEAGNIGMNGSSFGSGIGVLFIANATTSPTVNPSGGGVLYTEAGALKYRGPGGTVTTLATS